MIKHTDVHNSAKTISKGTKPTADVKVGYEPSGKGGSGAKLDSGFWSKGKSGVGVGGVPAGKSGSGGTNYFSELAGMAKSRENYPSAAK